MPSSYTTNLNLEKPAKGEQEGEGGDTLNANFDIIDTKLAIKDEDNMASDSASHLATQQSIKAYVDSQVATEDTLTELNDTSISSPAAGHLIIYDNTEGHWENATLTAGSNVSITNGDGAITIASTDTNTQLSQEQVEDYVGGMLDGTETFIDVSYDDTDGNIDFVVPVKDEDNMASDSATHLATQQSIKAYVDDKVSTTTLTLYKYTATAGQTTFTGSDDSSATLAYTANTLFVTLNGVVLENGTDYTATNGTSVVLTDAATVGDELNIYAFGTFTVTSVSGDFSIGDDLTLGSDGAIINMGADNDVTLTHVADTGIQLETAADSSTNLLQLLSDDAGAGAGPYLRLKRTSGSPADNDNGGIIVMDMENDNNQQFDAVQIMAKATDVSDGSEDSQLNLATMVNGTLTNSLVLENGRINSSAYSPAGSIVQVVQNTSVGQASTSSTSAVDVTNFTVDITPSSASNYIIVCISCHQQYTLVASTNVQYWHKFIGGNLATSGKLIPAQPWAGIAAESGGGGLQAKDSYAWIGMDNPESTSAVTYKVQHYVTNASSTGYCYYGQIVCMEVQV